MKPYGMSFVRFSNPGKRKVAVPAGREKDGPGSVFSRSAGFAETCGERGEMPNGLCEQRKGNRRSNQLQTDPHRIETRNFEPFIEGNSG